MGISRKSIVFFGGALVTLVVLAAWWTVFLGRSVALERATARAELFHRAEIASLRLANESVPIAPGPLRDDPELEAYRFRGGDSAGGVSMIAPEELRIRPTDTSLSAIEQRTGRRRFMVVGEGVLLFLLLAVCAIMLFHLALHERRHRRRMEDFVSAFSHELKTPLAGIKSLLETLVAGRVPAERQMELLELGLRQARRLQRGIEHVLLSGSLRTGRHELRCESVPVAQILERTLAGQSEMRVEASEKALAEIHWESPKNIEVKADVEALGIILDNLIDNGLKYGGTQPLIVFVSDRDQQIFIAVEDQGIGFNPSASETLFQPFERRATPHRLGHTSTSGVGLGLFIARTLARRMDGELKATSDGEGAGARFTLQLPLGKAVEKAAISTASGRRSS